MNTQLCWRVGHTHSPAGTQGAMRSFPSLNPWLSLHLGDKELLLVLYSLVCIRFILIWFPPWTFNIDFLSLLNVRSPSLLLVILWLLSMFPWVSLAILWLLSLFLWVSLAILWLLSLFLSLFLWVISLFLPV